MTSTQYALRMYLKLWHDRDSNKRFPAVVIYQRDRFIVIPIEQARDFVNRVHDRLDHDSRY